jgi:surface protein
MSALFESASSFNQDISQWDVSAVTSMDSMFYRAQNYNNNDAPLNWGDKTANVTTMSRIFAHANAFNQDINCWNVSNITNMSALFKSASSFNRDISQWDVSAVTSMDSMFYRAQNYNNNDAPLNWGNKTADVIDMSRIFAHAESFNQDISCWNVSAVTNMNALFESASSFNRDISQWDVSAVTSMDSMFYRAQNYTNNDVPLNWGNKTANVITMSGMFESASSFNQNISSWDVSNVENMSRMFAHAVSFHQDISTWNIERVTNMDAMFQGHTIPMVEYDALLRSWAAQGVESEVAFSGGMSLYSEWGKEARLILEEEHRWNITDGGPASSMTLIFNTAREEGTTVSLPLSDSVDVFIHWGDTAVGSYNSPGIIEHTYAEDGLYTIKIHGHLTSFGTGEAYDNAAKLVKVESFGDIGLHSLKGAFYGATNLESVPASLPETITSLYRTFYAGSDNDIHTWDISNVEDMSQMFTQTGMSKAHYDEVLNSWSKQNVVSGISFCAGDSRYSEENEEKRTRLTDEHGWHITDDGKARPMKLVFDTELSSGTTINIPLSGRIRSEIDWGDGAVEQHFTNGVKKHTYSEEGQYTVTIRGIVPEFGTDPWAGFMDNLTEIRHFGDLDMTCLENAFFNAKNLKHLPDSIPRGVTNLSGAFYQAESFNGDIASWDVSAVTDMSNVFDGASSFNQDISSWDVSNVENMSSMFYRAKSFNNNSAPLNWGNKTAEVTDMNRIFAHAEAFNQNISCWNVGKVEDMSQMFSGAESFNQDISPWNVSNVKYMQYMFSHSAFNHNINSWDVSNVEGMWNMFENTPFNHPLGSWDVGNVAAMISMFAHTPFDRDISSWDVGNVTNMNDMFYNATLSEQNYDALLQGWAARAKESGVQQGVPFHGGNSTCSSESAMKGREYLISEYGWTIIDGDDVPVIPDDETNHTGASHGVHFSTNPLSLQDEAADICVITDDPAQVNITIYDMTGNVIDEQQSPTVTDEGKWFSWDMRNRKGMRVSAGSYSVIARVEYENGAVQRYQAVLGVQE